MRTLLILLEKKEKVKLTKLEKQVLDYLTKSYNSFVKLEEQHPSEKEEFAEAIHKCQGLIALRIARKKFPSIFPTYKKKNE